MNRIFVDTSDIGILRDIENQLDDAGINYEYDSGDRFIVDDDDVDMALEIIEGCGSDPELI